MKLGNLWPKLDRDERVALATAAGIRPAYLSQLANHWRTSMRTSTMLALCNADARLTARHLLEEFSESSPKEARHKRPKHVPIDALPKTAKPRMADRKREASVT